MSSNLDKIMKPKAIAVIGASTKEHTIGSDIMKRLQEYKFNGNIQTLTKFRATLIWQSSL